MKAAREHVLRELYYYIPHDPDFKLYCHIPNELASLQYLELYYESEFNIPRLSKDGLTVYFDGEGNVVEPKESVPAVIVEISMNKGSGGEIDNTSVMKVFTGPFGAQDKNNS